MPLLKPRAGLYTGVHLRHLLRSQWYKRSDIVELQARKLEALLRGPCSGTSYYRDFHTIAGDPADPLPERLARLPILTKSAIRNAPRAVRTSSRCGFFTQRATTGGTTGSPIEVWRNQRAASFAEGAHWRGKSWRGIMPWDKGVLVQGFGRGSWYGNLRLRMARKWGLEAYSIAEQRCTATRELLERVRPSYIEGFVTDLLRLGERLELPTGIVRNVITTGEMLYDRQRTLLAKYFQAPVSDYYGSNEINSLAFECEKGTKHVTDEHVIVETLDENGRAVVGSNGRIVVTDLDNEEMPLIRYEIGDTGIVSDEPCPCGRRLTVLQTLSGRTQEALRNDRGEEIRALYLAAKFKDVRKIRRFQLVQQDLRRVTLKYEAAEPDVANEVAAIVAEITARLGREMVVDTVQVERMATTSRGKCPLIVALGTDHDTRGL